MRYACFQRRAVEHARTQRLLSDGRASRSPKLQSNRERGSVTLTVLGEREHELLSPVCKDAIAIISHGTWPFAGIRRMGMHAVCERIVEVQLRRKGISLRGGGRGADFEMLVDRSPVIPSWIDRDELCRTGVVCHLVPTQKLLA